MEITTNLEINNENHKELCKILECDKKKLPNKLSKYSSAALMEMVSMILGQKVFNRGSDILEYRLFLLIVYAFDGFIPSEQDVCKLFQTTITSSRSLIRAVMSKYQYQLRDVLENSLKKLISSVSKSEDGDEYIVSMHNLNLVDELNKDLAEIDTNLPPVKKKRGSVSNYVIFPSSYIRLCEKFGIKKDKVK